MLTTSVNGQLFRKLVTNGAINLKNNQAIVDELNVFPVPDGDTGTNMSMTIMSGVAEIENNETNSLVDLAKIFSRGLLMGARGNSGVILSQFFRGINVAMKELAKPEVSIQEFIYCLVKGYQTAYQAVSVPVEGTILTVMRESGEYINSKKDTYTSLEDMFADYVEAANRSLENTPNLLAQLKEAGVVDSGGAGFTYIITGMKEGVSGNLLSVDSKEKEPIEEEFVFTPVLKETKYQYELEFYIVIKNIDQYNVEDLRSPLSIISDKLEIIEDGNTLKVSMNTNNPSRALGIAQRLGDLVIVSVTNTKEELKDVVKNFGQSSKKEKYGVIAVCFGDGIKQTFLDLGVDYIIDGGQTMNPSTESFVKAVNEMNVENIIIIPNNSNIIMSASQTKQICEGKNIEVLKTKNICHGFVAMSAFDRDSSLEENVEIMKETISTVSAIEITYAVRDTSINGVEIHENDFMSIVNDEIISSTKERFDAVKNGLDKAITPDSFIVTIFAGSDSTPEELQRITDYLSENYPDVSLEVIDGKQDIYSYIISVQ